MSDVLTCFSMVKCPSSLTNNITSTVEHVTCPLCLKTMESTELSKHEVAQLAAYEGDLAKMGVPPNTLPDDDPRARVTELTKAQAARLLRLLLHQLKGEAKGRWQLPNDTVSSLMEAVTRVVMVMVEWPGAPQKPDEICPNCGGLVSAHNRDCRMPLDGSLRESIIAPEELSHILAALTFFRQARLGDAENRPPPIQRIATCGGTFPSLGDERLQLLIGRLDGAQRIMVNAPLESELGTRCSICNEPQHASKVGPVCVNGHREGEATPAVDPGVVMRCDLRRLRERSGLTMGDLARALGVQATVVSDLERGRIDLEGRPGKDLMEQSLKIVNDSLQQEENYRKKRKVEEPFGRCWNCHRIFGSTNESQEHAGVCPTTRGD